MSDEYFGIISGLTSIKLCIIGIDPYDDLKAMGIPFCTNTIEELFNGETCGSEILVSLGFKEEDVAKFGNPSKFFIWLAGDKGIVFLNLSYSEKLQFYNAKKMSEQEIDKILKTNSTNIKKGSEVNIPILKKVKEQGGSIVLLTRSFIKDYGDVYKDYPYAEYILHPSGKNKESEDYKKYYTTSYLKNKYLTGS